jgi:hypothetical protein
MESDSIRPGESFSTARCILARSLWLKSKCKEERRTETNRRWWFLHLAEAMSGCSGTFVYVVYSASRPSRCNIPDFHYWNSAVHHVIIHIFWLFEKICFVLLKFPLLLSIPFIANRLSCYKSTFDFGFKQRNMFLNALLSYRNFYEFFRILLAILEA